MPGLTIEQGINQVMGGRHIVILGAGASIASTRRNAERTGKSLPSMLNFIDILGMQDIVADTPEELRNNNFETLYCNIYSFNPVSPLLTRIQQRIQEYFGSMQLPDVPTIYDYLILSLRSKDHIATFNWDPFLYQAWCRNREFTKNLPYMSFLHGTVALGYSKEDKRSGPVGYQARRDGGVFDPVPLLYPTGQKNYIDDEFIVDAWDSLKAMLHKDSGSVRVNVFGYGAPVSDVEAVDLLSDAPDEAFRKNNPVPLDFRSLDKLWAWHKPLIDAELRAEAN